MLYFFIIPDIFCSLSPLSDNIFVTPQTTAFPVLYLKYYLEGLERFGDEFLVILRTRWISMRRGVLATQPGSYQPGSHLQNLRRRRCEVPKYDGNILP